MFKILISLLILPVAVISHAYTIPEKQYTHIRESIPVLGVEPVDLLSEPDRNGVDKTDDSILHIIRMGHSSVPKKLDRARNENTLLEINSTAYGELNELLEEKDGIAADTLAITGPIDPSDLKAVWNWIVKRDGLDVLDLGYARFKDDEIPKFAFYDPVQFEMGYWLQIRKIILPEGIRKIGIGAFALSKIKEINIPSTVREIGSSAFAYDRWLDCPISIPEGVEEISSQTFIDCYNLSTAPSLPTTLKKIGEFAFGNNLGYSEIHLPEGLEEIWQGAFSSTGLTSIRIPDRCLGLGDDVFQLCASLEEAILPEELDNIPERFFSYCYSLEKIKIPTKCKWIGEQAFFLCINLKEVRFNDNLEEIYDGGFDNCGLSTICLPESLKRIGSVCFSANDIEQVYCRAKVPPVCYNSGEAYGRPFQIVPGMKLYVPVGSARLYADAWGWDAFDEILEITDFPTEQVSLKPVIIDIGNTEKSNIYDLSGRAVKEAQPGDIYIRQGKKVMVK